jgi:hypothetical protein
MNPRVSSLRTGASRRLFLKSAARLLPFVALASVIRAAEAPQKRPAFRTRGVVLIPEDLTWAAWPDRAAEAGLTTVALHHGQSVSEVIKCVNSEAGQEFLRRARRLGLQVEYELHAMNELLPRSLFNEDKSLFRMDDKGERVRDSNLCVHSARAQEIVAANAVAIARQLRPSTDRYFYWGDDGLPWCRCPKCREFTDSEQALLLENHLVQALRRMDAQAQLAHLAYANTLAPPVKVKPQPGIFLEYAPIHRNYDQPYARQTRGQDALGNLDANLKVFPSETTQVLEYWLDVSRFSGWKRPARKLPWRRDVFLSDLETYAARGIRHVTSFACYIDADYLKLHGEPDCLSEYGAGLKGNPQRGRI